MYLSNLEFLRERDSSLLSDFDYDHNLFEYEQNSASPLLRVDLRLSLIIGILLALTILLLILLNSVIESLLLVLRVGLCFITISQLWRMRLLSSRLYLN